MLLVATAGPPPKGFNFEGFAIDHLGCHRAGSDSSAAAEGFKLAVFDHFCLIVYIQKNTHDVTAFCVSYCTYTACIFNFSNITWVLEMIHYFFTIHLFFLLTSAFIIISVF